MGELIPDGGRALHVRAGVVRPKRASTPAAATAASATAAAASGATGATAGDHSADPDIRGHDYEAAGRKICAGHRQNVARPTFRALSRRPERCPEIRWKESARDRVTGHGQQHDPRKQNCGSITGRALRATSK